MIPLPRQYTPLEGTLDLTALPFTGPPAIAELLAELGFPVAGEWIADNTFGEEAYWLRADQSGLKVRGRLSGLRWAVQTLRSGTASAWQSCEIHDAPRYSWRGSLLDVARWHLPIEFLHRYVDLMALHKLNRLHLHLTDDQGWRFEVKRYPRLTTVGGFRRESMRGHYYNFAFDGTPHGGFYTQHELKNLVAYAKRRGVEIMPEIDLPGHTQAAIAAYPQIGFENVEVSTMWGIHDQVLNTKDATVEFIKHVLDEVVEVFPFEYVHLGGDEVRSLQWQHSPAAQARADSVGDLLGWWIGTLATHLASHGRKTAVWDELLDADPPEGLLFFGWRDVTRAPAARAAGYDAVSCPHEHCYFDWSEGFRPGEPTAINGFVPLERVYRFEPGEVTGVQGQLWTEYLPTPALVEYRAFPRLAALAEVGWSQAPKDFAGFKDRLRAHLSLLDSLNVNYRPVD
ncbi:beta-N-acetylhexosaminidase [Allorhizocola rhizosphaerae]|uniref:beta-N-acetylhexosaminidase n=1 Tax=Allorhizocola rhizosphaerae TaxID=1872709 RepID=UPI000E3BF1E7|nr:beta-N-acetylhexosaminidase [Allorhizocola rhizosphaerae]